MARQQHPVRLLLLVLLAYALLIGGWWFFHKRRRQVLLDTTRTAYYHYDFIEPRLRARDPELRRRWTQRPPRVLVSRNGAPLTTIAGIREVELRWDEGRVAFVGRWPCPWNAPDGRYELSLVGADGELRDRLIVSGFEIRRRRPRPLPQRFVAVNWESVRPLDTLRVTAPDGAQKDWRGLLDWVRYAEADAFWVLLGQSPGGKPGEVWVSDNFPFIEDLAKECRARGIALGLYVMNYLTMSKTRLPRYEYALTVEDGKVVPTRAISLRDPRRPKDVADLLKRFQRLEGVEYVGLDYIRNALGGAELAEDFYAEMPGVRPPADWGSLSRQERMVYFERKKIMRRDPQFIDAWQWWRARRVALIVKEIRERLGPEKPLWAFTLTWDKGWHHGQDPVMMNDAGVDADALMLYEADAEQFEVLLRDWSRYVRRSDVQLVVGDVVDWPLHQRSPMGPREFYNRTVAAAGRIYADGPARGIFVHDLSRALWGRLGPYSTRQWMDEAKNAARHFRSLPR